MKLRRETKLDLLRSVPIFSACTKQELEAIASEADELTVPAGRELTEEGKTGREFVVLVSGAADVRQGGETVNQLAGGDFLGEIALLTGRKRTATVVMTAQSDILVLTERAFRRATDAVPSLAASVNDALAGRLRDDATV
ncbi:MAG: cyclic nucleotide-binding domain-containing protein [Actinobacteria bacterium]|nr:cyclic nucleotide-binding domain-containing protein [Actinomycetota bacterium]